MIPLEDFIRKMREVIPRVVVERAKHTNTPLVVWDSIQQKVREVPPHEIDQYLKEQNISLDAK